MFERGKVLSQIENALNTPNDPFLSFDILYKVGIINKDRKIIDETNKTKKIEDYISFGKIILAILGKSLAKSGRFNEVQLIYYNTNSKCSKASRINIANIPINKKFLKEFIEEKIEATLVQFSTGALIQAISKRFIENKASLIYGFSGIFTYDSKTGSTKVPDNLTTRRAESSQKEILYKQYYSEKEFRATDRYIEYFLSYTRLVAKTYIPKLTKLVTQLHAINNVPDAKEKFKIRRDFLLTVGYTHKHKNIVSVVSCFGDLIKDGYDLDLVIVGPQGNDEKNIHEKISDLGHTVILSIPNFGYWTHVLDLLLGRMPVNDRLPFQWYNTPNLHFATIKDFEFLLHKLNFKRMKAFYLKESETGSTKKIMFLPALRCTTAIYQFSKSN